jgi:hypothetical protein
MTGKFSELDNWSVYCMMLHARAEPWRGLGGLNLLTSIVENYAKISIYFSFPIEMLNYLACVVHRWKGVFKTFPTV